MSRDKGRLERMDVVRQAYRLFGRRRRALVGMALLSVVSAQVEAVALVLIGLAISGLAANESTIEVPTSAVDSELTLAQGATVALFLFLLAAALTGVYVLIQAKLAASIEREYRDRVVTKFAYADWETQSRQRAGSLQAEVQMVLSAPEAFSGLTLWIRSAATVVVFLTAALFVSAPATAITLVLGVGFVYAARPLQKRLWWAARDATRRSLTFADEFGEASEFAQDLRVFGAWDKVVIRLHKMSNSIAIARRRAYAYRSFASLVFQYGGPLVVLLVIAILSNLPGGLPLGSLAAVALLLLRSVQFNQSLQAAKQQLVHAVSVLDTLGVDSSREADHSPNGRAGRAIDRIETLELVSVSYRYPSSDSLALNRVSLALRNGSSVGVVGPSGSGKTTLAQILLQLRQPREGRLLANGRPAHEYSEKAWFDRVTYVPQNPRILHASVADNVAFFDESISRKRIEEACAHVGLSDYIDTLPSGLDTLIGPSTLGLSGGQVQRIGIARALARQPDVLVLDEPTSALDMASERLVQDSLSRVGESRSVLLVIIAHRLSTLSLCDQIVVLRGGTLEAFGTPSGVLERSEFFQMAVRASSLNI